MSKRLTGRNPLAYLGVEPDMPVNTYQSPNAPTPNDVQNFNLGDFWIDTTNEVLYVLVSQQRGVATWITTFGGAINSVVTDSGTATDIGGVINLLGDGTNISTTGSSNTINVNMSTSPSFTDLQLTGIGVEGVVQTDASGNLFADTGTNGQVLIGGGTKPTWATLTEGANIAIVNGPNSITISATGAGGGGAVNFLTDINSPATETGGDITMAGGANITTDGGAAPNTVTFDLTGTTNHAVQVGNASGSLTSLAVGTNGQVLIGSTGANPVFATLTSGDGSINFTPGPGTLSLQAVGGGGGGSLIITTYNTPGSYTWTKNINTEYVEVWGWCGGGGGGSGTSANTNRQGGAGGGSGSVFRFRGPASFFGATEPVEVGQGGTGGASVTSANGLDGTNGTASSFGNIVPPICVNNFPPGATATPLLQAGAGGSSPRQASFACGFGGGIFVDDANSVYRATTTRSFYCAPVSGQTTQSLAPFGNGGAGSFAVGADGLYAGGDGQGTTGGNAYLFMLGTSGGQGGSISGSLNYYNGGSGGTVYALDGTTVISAGGIPGVAGGVLAGGNGQPQPSSGGIVFGGTGGGGGAADANNGGDGGEGGFPGGGGGGGGATVAGQPSGAGGDGGGGLVIVIEWT